MSRLISVCKERVCRLLIICLYRKLKLGTVVNESKAQIKTYVFSLLALHLLALLVIQA